MGAILFVYYVDDLLTAGRMQAMRFEPGQSGNPAGRRTGQPNRLTMAARAQIAAGADPVGFLQRVMGGDAVTQADGQIVTPSLDQRIKAAMTLANKLVPDAKDTPVNFSVGHLDGPRAALDAMGTVTAKMAAGELTPLEASAVIGVIGQYSKAYELTELERRISELEQRQGAGEPRVLEGIDEPISAS